MIAFSRAQVTIEKDHIAPKETFMSPFAVVAIIAREIGCRNAGYLPCKLARFAG